MAREWPSAPVAPPAGCGDSKLRGPDRKLRVMKLIIADDHELVRDALATLIEKDEPAATVLQACDFDAAMKLANEHDDIDLILLDVHMPGMKDMASVKVMRQAHKDIPVVLVSGHVQRGDVNRGFELGASGFVPKTMSGKALVSVLHLIRTGARYVPELVLDGAADPAEKTESGDHDLSAREMDVLVQLVKGLSNKVIARNLNIEPTTVKLHLRSLFKKLEVGNRTEAALVARDNGLVSRTHLND